MQEVQRKKLILCLNFLIVSFSFLFLDSSFIGIYLFSLLLSKFQTMSVEVTRKFELSLVFLQINIFDFASFREEIN